MSIVIKAHFDGKAIIPDEPVILPINVPLELVIKRPPIKTQWNPRKAKAAVKRIASHAKPVGIPLDALHRENI